MLYYANSDRFSAIIGIIVMKKAYYASTMLYSPKSDSFVALVMCTALK